MSKSEDFKRRVNELQSHISAASDKASKKEKCLPTMLIAGVAAPFFVALVLYFLQPSFVQTKEGTKYVRSSTKVFYYTVAVTVVLWIVMYLFTYCAGWNSAAMLCASK
jgi:hypothetical protein